jgi:hypothetical protein
MQIENEKEVIGILTEAKAVPFLTSYECDTNTISVFRLCLENNAFYSDKEASLEAITHNGNFLKLISPDLQNDRDIVLKAVQQNGMSLK